jgi:hypothetical protein
MNKLICIAALAFLASCGMIPEMSFALDEGDDEIQLNFNHGVSDAPFKR